MRYYIYANTITDSLGKSNKSVFKDISKAIDKDILYSQQRFIGKGFAKILSFEEQELDSAKKALNNLENLKIKSVLIDKFETSKRAESIFKTAVIEEYEDRFRFINVRGNDLYIDKVNEILVIGGIDMTNSTADSLKKLCLSQNFDIYIYAGKEKRLIALDLRAVNYSKIKEASKYSKMENLNKVIAELKKKSMKYQEDFLYSASFTPDISPSLLIYSSIASFMFENGMYESKYAEEFLNPDFIESEKNLYYDFKYDIYRPGEISLKTKPVKKMNLFNTAVIPLIPALFVALFVFRTQANVLLMILCFSLFAYYGFHFFRILKMKLFFESVPFSKIKSMSVGLNEVSGTVLDKNAIPSPISGIKAVYFKYQKFRKEKVKENTEEWKLVEIGEYVPSSFFIESEGDTLEIKTDNSSINLHSSTTYHTTYYTFFCMEDSDKIKYVEEVLPVSSEIFVIGSAVYSDRNKEMESFIKNKKANREFMNKFDEDKNKVIDADEWDKAKSQIEIEFDEKENKKRDHEHLSIQYTKDDNILFISDMSEMSVLKRFNLFIIFSGIIGIISFIFGIILIWR